MSWQKTKCLGALAMVCFLSACSVPSHYYPGPQFPIEEYEEPVISYAPEGQPQIIQKNRDEINPAVAALISDANMHMATGDYHIALIKLERAARIQPNQAEVWFHMARVRYEEKDWNQSEQLARKALSLGQGDADLESKTAKLLVDIQGARDNSRSELFVFQSVSNTFFAA